MTWSLCYLCSKLMYMIMLCMCDSVIFRSSEIYDWQTRVTCNVFFFCSFFILFDKKTCEIVATIFTIFTLNHAFSHETDHILADKRRPGVCIGIGTDVGVGVVMMALAMSPLFWAVLNHNLITEFIRATRSAMNINRKIYSI